MGERSVRYRRLTIGKGGTNYQVFGWDEMTQEDDVYFGEIVKDRGYFWFKPVDSCQLLTYGILRDISDILSFANVKGEFPNETI